MSQTEPRNTQNLGFEVEISSGGRADDAGAHKDTARTLSPARAAAKTQARRRNFTIAVLCSLAFAGVALWAWLSNPNTNVPSDAVARVNGEFIYEGDINREIDLTRASYELSKRQNAELPGRSSVLEDLITRKMRLQDARKAGVVASAEETENELKNALQRTGLAEQQLQEVLSRYNLTLDDMRLVMADTATINKYINTYVISDANTDEERRNRINEWETSLAQTSKIERLRSSGSGPAPRIGSEAPDFTLKGIDGKEVKLSALKGRPVMVNFWATWCPPCRAEIPVIAQMYDDAPPGGRQYEILGVATQSDRDTIQAFVKELGINFPVLPDAENRVTDLYHVLPIPTTFFIDKDGIIRDMQIGPVDLSRMEKWLKQN